MHYKDQMALPGGSIGSEDTSSQGTRWLAPGAADDARDETLDRTTVRHGPGGWYVITAAKKAQQGEHAPRAICRCGPLKQWEDAERDLITATGAPAGSLGVELADAQSAAVDRVMREGLKSHVLDAAARWTRATGTASETMALAGQHVPPAWAHQNVLEQQDTPEGRKLEELFEELMTATETFRRWQNTQARRNTKRSTPTPAHPARRHRQTRPETALRW